MKKVKKLQLNKQVISSLQEKQMKSLIGGAALSSKGSTSAETCGNICGSLTCYPACVGPTVLECQVQNAISCCKNSCN